MNIVFFLTMQPRLGLLREVISDTVVNIVSCVSYIQLYVVKSMVLQLLLYEVI